MNFDAKLKLLFALGLIFTPACFLIVMIREVFGKQLEQAAALLSREGGVPDLIIMDMDSLIDGWLLIGESEEDICLWIMHEFYLEEDWQGEKE